MANSRKIHTLFQYPSQENLSKLQETCKLIEKDLNFKPSIQPEELLALVVDKDNKPKYDKNKKATVIFPCANVPLSTNGESLGALYIGAFAQYANRNMYGSWFWSEQWGVDAFAIFVNKKGETSIHKMMPQSDANQIINSPVSDYKLSDFLGQKCLHLNMNAENKINSRI